LRNESDEATFFLFPLWTSCTVMKLLYLAES
jgi:hypothetical protein